MRDGSRYLTAKSAAIILGSTYIPKRNMKNLVKMRRKSAVSLVARMPLRVRMAVSPVRMRIVRHRTRVRVTVLV